MSAFPLLLKDEFKGFIKSKVMIALWIGMPAVTILFNLLHSLSNESHQHAEQMPVSLGFAILVSGMGGTVASLMLAVNIIHEHSKNVFELFLIRPLKRFHLLVSKFIAVFLCVFMAALISLSIGIAYDIMSDNMMLQMLYEMFFDKLLETIILSITAIIISCAAGILIGVSTNSVLVGTILIFFVTSNLAAIILMLPAMIGMPNPMLWINVFGLGTSVIVMYISKVLFDKKQF